MTAPHSVSRKLWSGLLLNGGARALTVAAPMVTLPLVTDGLGELDYGTYAVVTAVSTFLPFADLGVALGMVTAISQANGRRDRHAVRQLVSTGFVMLLTVACTLLALAAVSMAVVDWRTALGLTDPRVSPQVPLAVALVLVSFAVGLPATVGLKIMLGLQMNRALAFWQAATVPLVVGAVALAHATDQGVVGYVMATTVTPHAVAAVATLWLLLVREPDLRPRRTSAQRRLVGGLLSLGLVFSVRSAAVAVGYSSSSVVISHVVGVQEAGQYNIAARLSAVSFMVFEGLLMPMWPIFGARLAEGDQGGVKAHLRVAILLASAGGLVSAVGFVTLAPAVIRIWVGAGYVPSTSLLIALGLWSFVQFVAYPYALLLSGAGSKGLLLWTAVGMAIVNLPLSILLARAIGIAGPTWASIVATVVCVLVPTVVYSHRRVMHPSSGPASAGSSTTTATAEEPASITTAGGP